MNKGQSLLGGSDCRSYSAKMAATPMPAGLKLETRTPYAWRWEAPKSPPPFLGLWNLAAIAMPCFHVPGPRPRSPLLTISQAAATPSPSSQQPYFPGAWAKRCLIGAGWECCFAGALVQGLNRSGWKINSKSTSCFWRDHTGPSRHRHHPLTRPPVCTLASPKCPHRGPNDLLKK